MKSKYFVHDIETGKTVERSEGYVFRRLGWVLLAQLVESGSLSCGKTVYQFKRNIETLQGDQFGFDNHKP